MGLEQGILLHSSDNIVPDGVIKELGQCSGPAWDNFDINIETINGLGTINTSHYGIVYQNSSPLQSVVISSNFQKFQRIN